MPMSNHDPKAALELTPLRHGRSRADDEALHEGRCDSPLTGVGVERAERLVRYWLERPPHLEAVGRAR